MRSGQPSESRKTVFFALAANASIAVAKAVGGVISGSSAMLAEAAHSVADTANQVFLLFSLAFGARQADVEHPFGYGKERFFWSFLAAVGIFVAGAGFSIFQGLYGILGKPEKTNYLVAYAVLGFALVAEGIALLRAVRQVHSEARRADRSMTRFVRQSRDPTTKTVLFEDTGAVIGVLLALGGIGLHQLTGDHRFDGAASIAIGLLLAVAAFGLGRDAKGLLIGESALPEERKAMCEVIEGRPEVDRLVELLTMTMGPSSLLVAAKLDLRDGIDSDRVEQLANEIDRELRKAVPSVSHVFLDPTPAHDPEHPPALDPRENLDPAAPVDGGG